MITLVDLSHPVYKSIMWPIKQLFDAKIGAGFNTLAMISSESRIVLNLHTCICYLVISRGTMMSLD